MPETALERKRRLGRESKRRQRQRQRDYISSQENEFEREIRRRKNCLRQRIQRLRESQEQMLERRRKDRERNAKRRRNSSKEEIEERKRKNRERIAKRSPEEIQERRRIERERIAFKRRNSSLEEKRRTERERVAERRRNSLQEEIEKIRRKNREIIAKRTAHLSPEEIEERRRITRERIAFKRRNSLQEETKERRKKERARTAERRKNESDEAAFQRRQKAAEYMRRLRAKKGSVTVSSVISSNRLTSSSQPTDTEFRNKTGSQFENQCFENREQKAVTHSVQPCLPAHTQMQAPQQMQVQQHLQVTAPIQTALKQEQGFTPSVQVAVAKPESVEKPETEEKKIFVVANHQCDVMSNLASLWKSGKFCDAGIGNGSTTVKVHKLVLYAVCPKLLSMSNTDITSHEFLQVNFPREVSTEALKAFAEYMYNGILDLNHDVLEQLKIIAKRLDMKEFEQLCNSHLPNHIHQPVSTTASFTNVVSIQTTMPIPAMTSSFASLGSTVSTTMQTAPFITPDIKQEISEAKLPQVKKEAADMYGQESEAALLAPDSFVIGPSIKTEPVGPEDVKYGHWSRSSSNQAFTSTISSPLSIEAAATSSTSSGLIPPSSTELPFSQTTDIKSTKLKVTHSSEAPLVSDLSPVLCIIETVCSQSNYTNKDSSKTSSQTSDTLPSVEPPNTSDAVYPVRLFSAKGDNLPLLTRHLSDAKTVNSFISSEKT